MSNKTLSHYTNTINKLNDLKKDELVNYIKQDKPFKIINILCLTNHDISDLINNLDINLFNDSKYVDYYNLIDNGCYYHFITILTQIKKTDKKLFFEIIKNHDSKLGWILFYAIQKIIDPIIFDLWELIKDINLLYLDKIKNVNLLFVFVEIYVKMAFGLIPNNNNTIDIFYNIILDYYNIFPEALYHKLDIPIINNILLYETRSFVIFPVEEYNKVKMDINPYIIKLLDKIIDETNVNMPDYRMENPLTYAIVSNHYGLINYLLDKGANINYKSYGNGIINIFELVITRSDKKIQELFYDKLNLIDFTYINHNLNTYAHLAFYNYDKLDDTFLKKILEYSTNLNLPNIEKNNILHIIFDKKFKDDMTKYFNILIEKKLDFSQIDIFGKSPIDILLLSQKDFNNVINNLVIPNYLHFMNQRIKTKQLSSYDHHIIKTLNIKRTNNISLKDLNEEIANYIAKTQISGQLLYDKDVKDDNILLMRFNDTEYSLFTATHFSSHIYTYLILKKYNNLGIPYTDVPKEIKLTCIENCDIEKHDNCINNYMLDVCNRIKSSIQTNIKYPSSYFNMGLLWHNRYVYHIPENILDGIKNVYESTNGKKYVFFININILRTNPGSGHANILIINLKTKIAIRFEPYGNVDWDEMKYFDELFQQLLTKELPNITYISNNEFSPNLSYQSLSGETNDNFIKIGDPPGYCLAWCYWFLESYMMYENKLTSAKQLKSLLDKLFKKITFEYVSLVDYIREYGNYLKSNDIKLFKKLNFPSDRIYNKYLSDSEYEYVFDYIENNIKKNFNLL